MVAPKKVIRFPEAYRAAVMRRQMAEQQAQNVTTIQEQGVPGVMDQQHLMQILLQQAAMREAQKKAVSERDSPLGVYTYVFADAAPLPGFNKRKAAYQDLNLGAGEGERGY